MKKRTQNTRKQVANPLFIGGVIGLIFGGIHLSDYLSTSAITSLYDAGINAGMGIATAICGWLILKGRAIAIPFATMLVLGSIAYGYTVGRGVNLVILIGGTLFVGWLLWLWKTGELA